MVSAQAPGSTLPTALATTSHAETRLRNSRKRTPAWLDDPVKRELILNVYGAYIERRTIQDISTEFQIKPRLIFDYVALVRADLRFVFDRTLEELTMQQVMARQAIIREARTSLRTLRESAQFLDPTTGHVLIKTIRPAEAALKARAEADLLRLVGEQEKEIELLLGLRKSDRAIQNHGDEPPPDAPGGTTIVIDMRTQTVNR